MVTEKYECYFDYMKKTGDYCSFCKHLQTCQDTSKRCLMYEFDVNGGSK